MQYNLTHQKLTRTMPQDDLVNTGASSEETIRCAVFTLKKKKLCNALAVKSGSNKAQDKRKANASQK